MAKDIQPVEQTGSNVAEQTATIANGASLSGAVNMDKRTLVGIVMPASWTAAGLTFQGSSDGTNYFDLYDTSGIEISHVVAASRFIRVSPADWVGVQWVKVRSGTSGTPVNQGAARDLKLVTKAV